MDPDFLMTSFPITMNFIHSRTEFSFWSIWSAPMLVATDVCNLSDEKKSILTNKEVLAVHSDPLFIAGERVSKGANGEQVWTRPLSNGDMTALLFNANNQTSLSISVAWTDLGWQTGDMVNVRDMWAQSDLAKTTTGYTAMIAPNDVAMLRLSKA